MAVIKEGNKVRIHCLSKKLYDNKVGEVQRILNLDTNPWGNVVVTTEDDYYQNCFLEEELELLEEEL